ncbi:protein kinase [Leishmania donovani]|uniref:Protein_kinase_putative/GeneDB:LmjF.02.0570 n=1 Tax=Leishmania donovani TaxID=5661 RepID=A0A6J8F2I5_LEIDO|nr:protein kinase [Leishmania donovani]VDZ41632.1 protein_kinase_putative/GeneDB:LmjF.02.0570 [Leishmania donovani]
MQTSEGGARKQSAKASETGSGATVASVKAAQLPRQPSYAPGTNRLPEVEEARRCSSIRKESDGRVAGRCTARSRDIASKNSYLSEGSGNQRQAEGSDREGRGNLCGNGHAQHSCALASRSYIKSDISMDTFVPHRELSEHGSEKDGQVQINLEGVEKSVFTPEQPASGDSTSVSRIPPSCDASATAAVDPLAKIETAVASTAYGESGSGARKSSAHAEKSMQPLRNQLRRFSSSKDTPRRRSHGICPTALVASRTLPVGRVETELADSDWGGASGSGDVAEAKVPSARTGCLPNTSVFAGDVVTTDTREGTSRDRRSAQFLREMLGVVEKDQAGSSRGCEGDGGNVNSAATVPNPLHHRNSASRASDSGSISDIPYGYGNEAFGTQSSATRRELHARNVDNVAGGDRDQYNTDSLVDGRSFGSYRGELEWLCVPSLFYLFANMIKWNELRLQRRTSQTPLEENRSCSSDESFSLASIWTPNREQELHVLEDRISFSVFELEGVYLNPLLVSWSKPRLRSLVADVAATWAKEGPYSAEFDCISSRLFDAISTEQTCQLRSTCLLSVRQWLGSAQHRWDVTCVLIALLTVSILCIVFLAVFGRTQAVCVVFSTMLSVAVVLMYVVAVFVLHHNTYADAASRYFREEVVRAAQKKMEEEEMAEKRDVGSRSGYRHRGAVKTSRDAADNGCRGYTAGDDDTGVDDEYMEDEISIAVRNLRALTEGSTHPVTNAPPYYRLSDRPHSGKCDNGGAGGGFEDDMTLADGNYASLTSRSLQAGDKAKQQFEEDRENRLLLSRGTFEQHQAHMDQRESHRVHERMNAQQALRPTKQATPSSTSGATGAQTRPSTADSGGSGRQEQLTRGGRDGKKIVMQEQQPLQQLDDLPENVNVTALLFCRNAGVLSQVASSLWERNFMLLRVSNLQALNKFNRGSERFGVVLIHAPDVAEGSAELETALSWLQVERRPVFFFSRSAMAYPASVPFSARLLVPFSSTSLNALLLAGIGVESEHGCVSSPLLPQQEQERHQQQCPSQPFQVPPYTLGRRLGGGAFGNVFEAEMEHTGARCAVKRMYLKEDSNQDEEQQVNSGVAGACAGGSGTLAAGANSATSPRAAAVEEEVGGATTAVGSQLRDIAQEVEIMSSLQHPNIVRYYYCERDDNCISIFMELCTGGSLRSLIHSGKLVNPPEIKHLLREIISAVSYLHNMRIVHRDLKPDNVLFRQGHIKITDFGTAVHKHGGDLRLIRGTFAYMAPEILVGDPYGRACDVWSIGCIAAEVLSVELPQHALGLPEMCDYYRAMGENSELPIECDVPGVRDFLLACLQRNPNQRSTAAELFYHPILQARDTSIHDWMVEVVARRRRMQQQQQALHRNGLGSRTGGGAGGLGGNHQVSSNGPNNNGGMNCANAGDRFDLHSVGSAQSLDSSKLV